MGGMSDGLPLSACKWNEDVGEETCMGLLASLQVGRRKPVSCMNVGLVIIHNLVLGSRVWSPKTKTKTRK